MTTLTCDELRAMAAEVALGILSGTERADALGHMEHCVGCRALVAGLAPTGDALLLLAPEADPPMGFESRVASLVASPGRSAEDSASPGGGPEDSASPGGELQDVEAAAHRPEAPPDVGTPGGETGEAAELTELAGPRRIRPKPPARRARTLRRRRTAVAVAAAAAALVGGTTAAVTVIDHSGSGSHAQVSDQTALRSGHFQARDGRPVGQVYAYSGDPSWIFMNVDASGANGPYTCELELANGSTVPVGQFEVHDGIGEWAHTVGVDVNRIRAAKLVTPTGLTLATATIS